MLQIDKQLSSYFIREMLEVNLLDDIENRYWSDALKRAVTIQNWLINNTAFNNNDEIELLELFYQLIGQLQFVISADNMKLNTNIGFEGQMIGDCAADELKVIFEIFENYMRNDLTFSVRSI